MVLLPVMASVGGLVANTHIAVAVKLWGARTVTIGITSVVCKVEVLSVLGATGDSCAYVFRPHCNIANFPTVGFNWCLKATTVSGDAADQE